MATCRDAFGTLLPLRGLAGSTRCCVGGCYNFASSVVAASQTTQYVACEEHMTCPCGKEACKVLG